MVKKPPASAVDEMWVRPLEEGMAPTLVLLPGESLDRGAWRATVYRVTQSQTQLK